MAFVEVLSRAAARPALADRDIGAVFRILRDAGITQVSIAHATGQKQSRSLRSFPVARCSQSLCLSGSQIASGDQPGRFGEIGAARWATE